MLRIFITLNLLPPYYYTGAEWGHRNYKWTPSSSIAARPSLYATLRSWRLRVTIWHRLLVMYSYERHYQSYVC
ncbi:MAG: hypothetical protein [Inoviridae sp.]|nr:MAG: hypothetical protein [Inoviridae sp.]